MTCVSPSPSKIPYGGFSPVRLQTGIQPLRPSATPSGLSDKPTSARQLPPYTQPPTLCCAPVALSGKYVGADRQSVPVQRPLARQTVLLSARVLAYYGLIRASPPLPTLYVLCAWGLARRFALGWVREGPQFTLLVCSLRAVFRTPTD